MKIELEIEVSHLDLFNAVSLIMGKAVPAHANQVIADYFTKPIKIDWSRCLNPQERAFHLNGFVANVINMTMLMEDADKVEQEKAKPKIITLANH